jgi:glutamate-ammonia-ligase adenylyltransferase
VIGDLIYRGEDRAALARDVRSMRKRMEEELGKEDRTRYNIKQGTGGLVDIEFLAQFLQLLNGPANKRVRVPGTYHALHALRREALLEPGDYAVLMRSYLFIRLLESRMRVVTNRSSHALSKNPRELHQLAKRAGYQDNGEPAGEKLLREYERTRGEVRRVFEKIVTE